MWVSFVTSSVCLSRGKRLTPRTNRHTHTHTPFSIEFIHCLCIALKWNWTGVGIQSKPFVKLTSSSTITISIKLSVCDCIRSAIVRCGQIRPLRDANTRFRADCTFLVYENSIKRMLNSIRIKSVDFLRNFETLICCCCRFDCQKVDAV